MQGRNLLPLHTYSIAHQLHRGWKLTLLSSAVLVSGPDTAPLIRVAAEIPGPWFTTTGTSQHKQGPNLQNRCSGCPPSRHTHLRQTDLHPATSPAPSEERSMSDAGHSAAATRLVSIGSEAAPGRSVKNRQPSPSTRQPRFQGEGIFFLQMTHHSFSVGLSGSCWKPTEAAQVGGENTPGPPISTPLRSAEETRKAKGKGRPNVPARRRESPSRSPSGWRSRAAGRLWVCQGWCWSSSHQGAQA